MRQMQGESESFIKLKQQVQDEKEDLEAKIKQLREEAAQTSKPISTVEGERKQLSVIIKKIEKKHVSSVNKLLERTSPAPLIRGLEALVALMRNQVKANSDDV